MHLHKYIPEEKSILEMGMESIDFQFDEKYIALLRAELKTIQKQDFTETNIAESNFSKILEDMTGLKIRFEVFSGVNAAVFWPKSFSNHPFYGDFERNYTSNASTKKDLSTMQVSSYGIDLKKGKIYGTLTKHVHKMRLGTGIFSAKANYTVDEALAILFHEVGHLMSFYEWAYRLNSTNYLLSEFTKRLLEANISDRMVIITKANKQGLCKDVKKELLAAKTADEVRVLVMDSQVRASRSDLGTNIYDVRGWEMLADQYVVRLGLGASLHTGLRKFGGIDTITSRWVKFTAESIFYIAATVAAVVVNPLIFAFLILVFIIPVDHINYVYDTPFQRLKVIRQQTIARLKVAPTPEAKKVIMAEIAAMDAISEKDVASLNVVQFIQKTFFPFGRARYRNLRTQQVLEQLANSELSYSLELLKS